MAAEMKGQHRYQDATDGAPMSKKGLSGSSSAGALEGSDAAALMASEMKGQHRYQDATDGAPTSKKGLSRSSSAGALERSGAPTCVLVVLLSAAFFLARTPREWRPRMPGELERLIWMRAIAPREGHLPALTACGRE